MSLPTKLEFHQHLAKTGTTEVVITALLSLYDADPVLAVTKHMSVTTERPIGWSEEIRQKLRKHLRNDWTVPASTIPTILSMYDKDPSTADRYLTSPPSRCTIQ